MIARRGLLAGAAALTVSAMPRARAADTQPLTMSYQESSVLLQVTRLRGTLVGRLQPLGFAPSWSKLGRSIAEIGFTTFQGDVADSVPGVLHSHLPNLILYAAEGPSPHATGILARADSPIHTLADLKGRRVAVGKGGSSFDLLLRGLESVSLTLADIQPIYLPEAGSSAAFRTGSVDAWATYDPFLSSGQADPQVRLLTDGAAQGMRYDRYYMVDRDFASAHPAVVQAVFDDLRQTGAWITANPGAVEPLLSRLWQNMALDQVRRINAHRTYAIRRTDTDDLARIEQLAIRFARAGVIPDASAAKGIGLWSQS